MFVSVIYVTNLNISVTAEEEIASYQLRLSIWKKMQLTKKYRFSINGVCQKIERKFNWKEENKMTTIGFANVSFSVISLVMLVVDTVIKVGIASFAIKLLIDYIFRKIEKLKEK